MLNFIRQDEGIPQAAFMRQAVEVSRQRRRVAGWFDGKGQVEAGGKPACCKDTATK
jgi:hypothetical protein